MHALHVGFDTLLMLIASPPSGAEPLKLVPRDVYTTEYLWNHAICKGNDESASDTVSKVESDKAFPKMDILMIKSIPLDVQYNTESQISLIATSALKLLLRTSYSLGNSNMIKLLA